MTYEAFALITIAGIVGAAGIAGLRWYLSPGAQAQRKLNCAADILKEWRASRPQPLTIDQSGYPLDAEHMNHLNDFLSPDPSAGAEKFARYQRNRSF